MESHLKEYTDEDDSFKKGCTNALSHITTISFRPPIIISPFCEYTNYWFYSKLKTTNKITYNQNLLENFFNDLGNSEKCIEYTEAIDENTYNDLEKLDKLYDKFYSFAKKETSTDSNNCNYGEECAQEYRKHEDTCRGKGNNSFCNELENFRVRYNNHLTSIKNCNNLKELPSFQGSSLAATISLPVSVMSAISFFSFITYKVGKFFVQN
ncbi:hypothetical protein PCYB_007960 [Plasmodium cynomolgi strain B]|uniref:CYIR protein n=1 Tax=Plasmodium cynomolgi (strain B) TaxID=1120755 RepID=K6VKT5_PLACD|nr:hypothetical protein PCYB_007960 [Plasmodium cynomolgi strain B]GAB70047.1 hypothetical protein PCYB_007960 [Plasmodium cynomolgi strain B]